MGISTIHHSAKFTRAGLLFVAIVGGCDAPVESIHGESDDSQTVQLEAAEPEAEPDAVIPASPEGLARTGGVTAWEVYAEEAVRIVGVDADARAIVELQLAVERDDSGAPLGVTMQMGAQDGGFMSFDASGQLRENTLSDAHGRLFEALAADIQASGGEVQFRSLDWDCAAAWAGLVAACGWAVATCLLTGGVGCALNGASCVQAAAHWAAVCF